MPMLVLVGLCLTAAVVPRAVVGLLSAALSQFLGRKIAEPSAELERSGAPIQILGSLNAVLIFLIGSLTLYLIYWARKTRQPEWGTWGCGFVKPTPRIQYTGRSFTEMLAEHLLPSFLRPRTKTRVPQGLFPATGDFRCETPDPVSERIYEPFFRRWGERFYQLRILQMGHLHIYLLYIAAMVVLALAWVSARTWWAAS